LAKEEVVKKKRVFADVNAKGLGGPTASGLNDKWTNPEIGEHGGATCAKGLTGNVGWEKGTEAKGRDCHGYEKPAGKCCGFFRGTGTGWEFRTLQKPVPVPRVCRV
jgi:hypothetical protein